ncbi:threonine ammonia-lyase IlvA [Paenibacillus radicis (ex Gao et al. 2016)]|uniref:L-threonine dehydratase n=1 Tax=Paenibacillus radicis (ex Gao et al. 2016) TaxID=1737354 RepID=A0A917LXV7_9BACL|nr:threonine ammonia-lyase IlvA [Paenibacillus radicis (ex Gao et al. 2016)]GGG66054.1 L-threonine dehydratase [Paenibacillus radicis (ex Gao et al. 2016)]
MEASYAPKIGLEEIVHAQMHLKDVITRTPLQYNRVLSERYGCTVLLKREDLQIVRSFKIRGAYHTMRSLAPEKLAFGVICASAGNHAQGVAYSCQTLGIPGKIYMPSTTPRQKVNQVSFFGGSFVEVILTGDTFDDAYAEAVAESNRSGMAFIHPFDDLKIIAGNGTVGQELMEAAETVPDYVLVTVGGGGLAAGVASYVKAVSPTTQVIGVEPEGAPSLRESLDAGEVISLDQIEKFVDGAAVKRVGDMTFAICRELLDDVIAVPEGKICTTLLDLYNENAIVAEPAGAVPIAALEQLREQIAGKTVVCVISGGNNDVDRMQEIKERSLIYEGLKHYFMLSFPQRAGALREFLDDVLGPTDDITRFEYTKKHNKDNGPSLVGIELKHRDDYAELIGRLQKKGIQFVELNKDPVLFNLLI